MAEHKAGNRCCCQQYKILQLNPVKVTEVLQRQEEEALGTFQAAAMNIRDQLRESAGEGTSIIVGKKQRKAPGSLHEEQRVADTVS